MPRLRYSTSTLTGEEFVPWLASAGELAYSPHLPPEKDYYFQYSWVIPGIFSAGTNGRQHFWFGAPDKDSREVRLLFTFWNKARRGEVDTVFMSNGLAKLDEVRAPLAVYRHSEISTSTTEQRLIFMQHGSYLITDMKSQPYINRGDVVLYRGIESAKEFLQHRLTTSETRRRLMSIHSQSLADSVTSFNAVHCNVSRTETACFKDKSNLLSEFCLEAGLETKPPITSLLYSGYALKECYSASKFGPNYVKFRTPLTNIRITTFVCNETEVKVIDPNKLEVIESVGCSIREVCV